MPTILEHLFAHLGICSSLMECHAISIHGFMVCHCSVLLFYFYVARLDGHARYADVYSVFIRSMYLQLFWVTKNNFIRRIIYTETRWRFNIATPDFSHAEIYKVVCESHIGHLFSLVDLRGLSYQVDKAIRFRCFSHFNVPGRSYSGVLLKKL